MAGEAQPATTAAPVAGRTANKVPEMIKAIQSAKATGKFSYQAGRADRLVNLALGVSILAALAMTGRGLHCLANGYGKKDGF